MSNHTTLNLLFVIDNLYLGGAQRQIVNLATGLAKKGYKIDFFCYSAGSQLENLLKSAGIRVFWSIKNSRFSANVFKELRNIIKKNNYDLVLSYLTTPNFYATFVTQFLIFPHIPVVVSERRVDLPGGANLVEKLSRQIYRFSSYVITNSYSQQSILISTFPWLNNKISTIYNGIDLEKFSPAIKKKHNYPIKIIAIASVVAHKNVQCLVQAMKILQKQDLQLPEVYWVGRNTIQGEDQSFFDHINQQIRESGIDKNWHWLDFRPDIVELLNTHDVLVHPSIVEGLPNVVCEALSCGCPVIVSDTLDHVNLVQNGESGYLFNPHDPKDLAKKIQLFIDLSEPERQEMGMHGRNFAVNSLSLERLVNDYENVIFKILDNSTAKHDFRKIE